MRRPWKASSTVRDLARSVKMDADIMQRCLLRGERRRTVAWLSIALRSASRLLEALASESRR